MNDWTNILIKVFIVVLVIIISVSLKKKVKKTSGDTDSFVNPEELKVKSEELEKLKSQFNKEKKRTEKKINELDEVKSKLDKETQRLKTKISELETQLEDSKKINISLQSGDTAIITKDFQQQIEKLKKQLNDINDELEDAEEEASEYKNRWRKEKEKSDNISLSLEEYERKLKKIEGDLRDTQSDLDNSRETLSQKEEAINFINAILSARPADDKNTKEIYRKIENIQSFVEENLCNKLINLNLLKKEDSIKYKEGIWEWANLEKKTWLKGKKIVAFVGEFSAGKTSIVNRILSQDDDSAPKLPVSSKATTAIATYISYNDKDFNSQFTDPTGKLKNIRKSIFEKVNKEILSEVNVSSLIQYFVMSYNNKKLENLSILDTPGFSSNDSEDAKRTSEVIKEADILFWVFDANSGEINQASLNTIQKNLQGLPLFIVINKSDTKSPGELDKLEEHIKQTINKSGIKVNGYIRFSQDESVEKLMEAIKTVPVNQEKNTLLKTPYLKLKTEYEKIDIECSRNRKRHNQIENNLLALEQALKKMYFDLDNDFKSIPEAESKNAFFGLGDKYFKLSENDYKKLKKCIESIKSKQVTIKNTQNKMADLKSKLKEVSKEWEQNRSQQFEFKGLKEDFEKHLKRWDSNYKDKLKVE